MVEELKKGRPITQLVEESIPDPESDVRQVKQQNRPFPIIESVIISDIFVGNDPPPFVKLARPFVEVSRLVVLQTWDADTFAFEEFSDDVPLTDGIQINIGDIPLLPSSIKKNEDYMKYSYDVLVIPDTKPATKHTTLAARFSFGRFMGSGGRGINLTKDDLRVVTADNFTVGATDWGTVIWTFEGWGWGT